MSITREFNLFLNAGRAVPPVINVNQYDSGESWVFTLYDETGTKYIPSTGAIVGIKSDNLGIINTGTVDSSGRVVITETQQMTAAAGKAVYELLLDNQTHGTANFVVMVEPKPGNNADLSESDLSLIQEAINSTNPTAIAGAVTDWMDANLSSPTNPVVDASLTVSGAAADAAVTGSEISDLKSRLGDLDDLDTSAKSDLVSAINEVKTNAGVADGSVTTAKLASHAVTMDKTDFYYSGSLSREYAWIYTYYSTYMRVMVKWTEMPTILNEFPEKLSIVFEGVTDSYWHSGGSNMSMATTSHTKSIPRAYKTITVDGVMYGVLEFLRSDFETAYNELKTYVDNGESWKDSAFQVTNSVTRVPSGATVYFIAGEVTSELIELGFSTTVLSSDFATAVHAAMSGSASGTTTYDEELAKARLSGKVMVNIGDSYTRNAGALLSALGDKYEMVTDNQGYNGYLVTTNLQTVVNNIVSAYSSGKTIDGTTYDTDDVAIITFMGGANDGGGISTFVGDGLHVTDTSKIYGACHYIFNLLAKTFTNAHIVVIAQPSNYNQSVSNFTTDAQAQALGFTNLTELQRLDDYQLSEYIMRNKEKAILDTAKAYSLPTIDAFSDFPTMLNPSNRSAYWQSDKIHINTAGSQLIVNWLDKKIVELVVG